MRRGAGQGSLSVLPTRRTRWVAAVVALWLLLLLALAGWWTILLYSKAKQIEALQVQLGQQSSVVADTRLMLVGESAFFLLLILALSAGLAWLYLREHQRARAMQAFFASVTHELRTPLTSIRLQAEAIAEGGQRAELAKRLLQDSHRLEAEIDNTLELARIEGGGSLSEQAVPLLGWLERLVVEARANYGERLRCSVDAPADLPAVLADAAALQIVMRNLLENSVRHSGRDPVQVQLTARVASGQVLLRCADDGRGPTRPGRSLGQLFARGSDSPGSGIGLYLVRTLMQRMGGRVEFRAGDAGGFVAELQLRAANEEAERA
jgi:signal transduction histidine kinase